MAPPPHPKEIWHVNAPAIHANTLFPAAVLGLAVLLLPALSLVSSATAASARPAAQPRACSFTANPYSVRRSVLTACGYKLFTVQSVRALPGGGEAYTYDDAGLRVTEPVPPKGFDPLTAPASRLREYGLPLPSQLGHRQWVKAMRALRFTTPPRTIIAGGDIAADTIDNFDVAGWADQGHSDYNDVVTNYTEPSISSSSCPNPLAEVTSVGLGQGGSNGTLALAGTAYGLGHPHGAFQQLSIPGNAFPLVWSSWNGRAGDTMTASVSYDIAAANNYDYFVEDEATGQDLSIVASSSHYDGTSANFFTSLPNPPTNLANFGTIPFTGAQAGRGTTNTTFHNLDYYAVVTNYTMVDGGGTRMAYSPEIYGDGSDFEIHQNSCD